ncbi:transforming growth factor-beta receptor-associated protein 1 isoform X2 [Ananas comosus]|uniref:Transforming growth factor-beta receptor-associated protein 1 isoform X2 n=1 Tax=Ananas comosus TaxID=4615 RepID=A0A6P5GEB8_ANACO|nr:transforming growth factor-beta receptor-associated protein 1 isoform X2 [Ananas comosus]
MATLRSKDRAVLEPFAEVDPAKSAGLPPSAPLTIRSLDVSSASDSKTLVYVGTGGGKIVLLSVDPSLATGNGRDSPASIASSAEGVEFLRLASVGSRVVESILVLSEIGRILVLSGGSLFIVDSVLSQPVRKIGVVKDVTAVAKRIPCSEGSGLDFMGDGASKGEILSSGKKLLMKLGVGIKANGSGPPSSEPPREGRTSCFVAAAVAKKLVLIELMLSGSVDNDSDNNGVSVLSKEIQGIDGAKAMAWLGDSIIVGTLEGYTLFSVVTGKCTPIFTLPESSGPPRLKPLWRSKDVLLLVDNVGIVVNSSGQPVGGSFVFRQPPDSVADMSSYVVVTGNAGIEIHRRKTGACVQSVSLAKHGSGSLIVANDDQGSGEVVVIATPYKVICFRKVSAEEQIKSLLRKKKFTEAICLVEELESDGEMTKDMLSFVHAQVGFLLLFDLRFEDAVNHFLLSETMQPSEIFPFIMRDPNRWSQLVPRNRYWGLHPPPAPLEEVIDNGLMAIQRAMFLKKAGVDTTVDEDFLLNPPSRADLLESAIRNIIRYLHVCRNKVLLPPIKEGVDTLLMYLYRSLDLVDDMEKLASSQNSCIVEELEALLDDSGHLRTLAFLYASKEMSSKALAIWCVLARNYAKGLWKNSTPSSEGDSLDISLGSTSGQKIAAAEASKILQESSDQDLILEHLGWIADIDQELAVAVLTSEKRINQLLPEKVLAAIDSEKAELRQRYLQWLIEDQDCEDSQYHTLYAVSLAKSVMEAVYMDSRNEDKNYRDIDEMDNSSVEARNSHNHLVREKLQLFLQASDLYDPEEVLDVIEESELWLEKAILYRKMGQENIVLQILALKLEDSEAAEQYCAEIGRDDAYIQLLDLYLDPQNGKEPMFTAAVRLLHNHGESLDPLQVLEKLSPDMPLQLASDTILRMLRARVHHHREGQIVHNLSRAINLDARLTRLEERSRHVQLNDESICDSCRARLGTKLFVMYPDDSVVCYRCYRNQGDSSSSSANGGRRSLKKGIIFKPGWLVSR